MEKALYTIDDIRKIVGPIAEKYCLPAVYVFGSYALGTQTPTSDIDTSGTSLTSLFSLGALYNDFDNAFKVPVDMVTVGAIEQKPKMPSDIVFRDNVLRDRRQIYGIT